MIKPRLEKFYEKVVCEDLILLYNFKNISQLPAFERGILHSTSHKFVYDEFSLLQSFSAIFLASGERPIKRKAHKSIAQFSIRKDNILGLKVTLRRNVLFTLLDKLLVFVVPKLLFDLQSNAKSVVSLQKTKKQKKSSLFLQASTFSNQELLFRGKQDIKQSKNVVISYKDLTCFPETAHLLMFFNSVKGFSFDCSFLLPTPNKKSVESELLESNLKKNDYKQLNDFSSSPITRIRKGRDNCCVKNQFISAFQYPINIF